MALQQPDTTTSSPPAPTGTASTQPLPTNTPSSGLFTVNGSPPLILAFLAVGLFVAAMIAVFGWRRIHLGRQGLIFDQRGTPVNKPRVLGKKPQLWDLWTDRSEGQPDKWKDMLPFSAHTISDNSTTPNDTTASNTYSQSMPVGLRYLTTFSFRHGERNERPNGVQPSAADARLQVAVAIAMPSQHKLSSASASQSLYGDEKAGPVSTEYGEERLEFAIGLIEVPWQHEEASLR